MIGIHFFFFFVVSWAHGANPVLSQEKLSQKTEELTELVQKMVNHTSPPKKKSTTSESSWSQGLRQQSLQAATIPTSLNIALPPSPSAPSRPSSFAPVDSGPYFDIPITYNSRVKHWINFFQGPGQRWYRIWLERSHRYLPIMQGHLRSRGLPQDLAYVAMIESGFSANAVSHAQAVGYWQFIESTANRYGLQTDWWLDERRDFIKSTHAAANYLADLYKMFDSWYLTAAAYNMGEGRLRRLIRRHGTNNYWILSSKPDFPKETRDYIPKLIAAMLIAKAPKLYGFHELKPRTPYSFEYFHIPGGTELETLAEFLNIESQQLKTLNPELLKGLVPSSIEQIGRAHV